MREIPWTASVNLNLHPEVSKILDEDALPGPSLLARLAEETAPA